MLDKIEGADVSAASTVDETTADHDAPAPTVIVSDHYRLVNENRLRVRSDGCVSYILGRKKFRRLFFRVGGRVRGGGGGGVPGPYLHPQQGNPPALLHPIPSRRRRSPAHPPPSRSLSRRAPPEKSQPGPLPPGPPYHPPRPGGVIVREACAVKAWRDRSPFQCGGALVRGPVLRRGCSLRAQGGTLHTNVALPRLAGPGPLGYPPRPGRLYLPGVCVALMPAAWCP